MNLESKLRAAIRDVKDFPKVGILFKDISPIMLNPVLSGEILDHLVEFYASKNLQAVAGIESRGFLFGYPLAIRLGLPFILIRKAGKLPYDKISYSYELEYGSAVIEMHSDSINPGDRVLIHDDLLATGGSAEAAAELISKSGGEIAGFSFLVGLSYLNGQVKLEKYTSAITNLISY